VTHEITNPLYCAIRVNSVLSRYTDEMTSCINHPTLEYT